MSPSGHIKLNLGDESVKLLLLITVEAFAAPPSPQNDEVFRDMPRSTTMPLPKQHQLEARGTDQEQGSFNTFFSHCKPSLLSVMCLFYLRNR